MLISTDFAHGIIRKAGGHSFLPSFMQHVLAKDNVKGTVQGPRENEHLKATSLRTVTQLQHTEEKSSMNHASLPFS